MKKMFISIIVILFTLVSMSFTVIGNIKTSNKVINVKGTIIADKDGIKLKSDKLVYQLTGQIKGLNAKRGQIILVNGFILNKELNVRTYKIIKKTDIKDNLSGPLKEKIQTLKGTVLIDTMQGAHIAFKVNGELYSLTGKLDDIEALNGKIIEVTGYAPYIVYIRKPDFIIFNVYSYRVVD